MVAMSVYCSSKESTTTSVVGSVKWRAIRDPYWAIGRDSTEFLIEYTCRML
jgi:hypothetical protein